MRSVKLWIDDLRDPPDESWTWVKDSASAMGVVALAHSNGLPLEEISFDHDLGADDTAMPVARMVEEGAYRKELPPIRWHIHSANPVGRLNLRSTLESADRYWSVP
jgi:hypothetical protein